MSRLKGLETQLETKVKQLEVMKAKLAVETDEMMKGMFETNIATTEKAIKLLESEIAEAKTEDLLMDKDWSKEYAKYPILEAHHKDTMEIGTQVKITSETFKVSVAMAKAGKLKSIIHEGPTGTGKTTFMRALGFATGQPVISLNCSSGLDEEDILGKYIIVDGKPTWVDGSLVIAMKTGSIFVLEEINSAKPAILIKLNSLLDDLAQVEVRPGEMVKAAPGFIFAGTLNLGYGGTREMNLAFCNRFQLAVSHNSLTETEFKNVLKSKIKDVTENELNIAWFITRSLENAFEYNEFDAAISVRQAVSLITTKRFQSKFDNGNINPSWTKAISLTVANQVGAFNTDVNKQVKIVAKALVDAIDKKTGVFKVGTQPQGETQKNIANAKAKSEGDAE